jgi:hypothetical protein
MSSDHAAPGFWKSFAKSVIFLMDFSTAVAMAYESRYEARCCQRLPVFAVNGTWRCVPSW